MSEQPVLVTKCDGIYLVMHNHSSVLRFSSRPHNN